MIIRNVGCSERTKLRQEEAAVAKADLSQVMLVAWEQLQHSCIKGIGTPVVWPL